MRTYRGEKAGQGRVEEKAEERRKWWTKQREGRGEKRKGEERK